MGGMRVQQTKGNGFTAQSLSGLLLFFTYLRITRGCSASTDLLSWQISSRAQTLLYVARKLTVDE